MLKAPYLTLLTSISVKTRPCMSGFAKCATAACGTVGNQMSRRERSLLKASTAPEWGLGTLREHRRPRLMLNRVHADRSATFCDLALGKAVARRRGPIRSRPRGPRRVGTGTNHD